MTDERKFDLTDESLQRTFAEAAEIETLEALSGQDVERIWQAVAGELGAEERREVVDELATDPAKARAWRLAHEMCSDAGDLLQRPQAEQSGAGRGPSWQLLGLAAAVILALGLALVVWQRGPEPEDVVRGAGDSPMQALTDEACRAGVPCTFEWSPVDGATSYRIRIVNESLEPLVDVADLSDSRYVLPPEQMPGALPADALWRIEASLADGTIVESTTHRRTILASP